MRFLTIIFSLFAVFALCSAQASILDDLNQYPDLSILVSLLRATGLDQVLGDINGPQYTLFAPNNTAFKALPPTILKALPGNVELLKSVLLYHVVPGVVYSNNLLNGTTSYTSAQGSEISVNVNGPLNALSGAYSITLNNARVIIPNIFAANGVVHTVDRVLLTDSWNFVTPQSSIYTLIAADPNFTILTSALVSTGLNEVLAQSGTQYTLFAPTNAAFNDPILAPLLSPCNSAALKKVLLYHVLGAAVYSTNLSDGLVAPTALGTEDTITVRLTSVLGVPLATVNDASIIAADTSAFNGVFHTIDRVLLPPSL